MNLLALCMAVTSTWATAEVQTGRFRNRDAWILTGRSLRVTVLQSGGHIAEITLAGNGAVNPLWVPGQATMDAEQYNPSVHQKVFGGGSAARLMAGLMGHNLCFPYWGDPSPAEAAAGMTFHGETGIVRWRQTAAGADFMTLTADLTESGTSITRTFRLKGQVVEVEASAANERAWDRPVGWCEHVTLGAPFLERGVTEMQASLTRGRAMGTNQEFVWPEGMAEKTIDLRKVRNLPQSQGFVNNFLVDPQREYGFLAAFHAGYGLVFGYVFPREEYPWLNVWEANSPEMLTRGLEFSNTPVHGTLRTLVKTPALWGTATFNWLPAKQRITKRFRAFSMRAPKDFRGVGDVRFRDGNIEILEQGTSRVLRVPRQ